MGVKYVISEPEPAKASWWAKNKTVVIAVTALATGYWLAGGCESDAAPAPPTAPAETAPAEGDEAP